MKADTRIEDQFWEDDTYWIELSPGWVVDGVHAIAESTKAEAMRRLKDADPCSCAECKRLIEASQR